MHVLFLIEKQLNCCESIPSNAYHNLVGSFECSKLGTYEIIYIDQVYEILVKSIDDADIVILSCVCYERIYKLIIGLLPYRNKTILIWFDFFPKPEQAYFKNVVLDISDYNGPNLFSMWTPQDTRIFNNNDDLTKDFDVTFVGNINNYHERIHFIEILKKEFPNKFNHVCASRINYLNNEKYSEIHKRSKICINFSRSLHKNLHLKGRVFEQ